MTSEGDVKFYDDGGSDEELFEDALEELALEANNKIEDVEKTSELHTEDSSTVESACLGNNVNNSDSCEKPEMKDKELSYNKSPLNVGNIGGRPLSSTVEEGKQECDSDIGSSSSSETTEVPDVDKESEASIPSEQSSSNHINLHDRLNSAKDKSDDMGADGDVHVEENTI